MAAEKKNGYVYTYLKGMYERGKLTAPRVVAAHAKGWISQEESDELMSLLLDAEAGHGE